MKKNRKFLLKGKFIILHIGASCNLPVFRSNEKGIWGSQGRYRFDSYGMTPSNWKKWGAKNFGMCGSFGYSNNVEDLIESISELNSKNIAAPICETLFKECCEMGATIVKESSLELLEA